MGNYLIEEKVKGFSFDWDDNIFFMPTKIKMEHFVNGSWEPIDVSTTEFTKARHDKNYRLQSDAFINPRYGYLQKLSLPYLFLAMVITPIIGFTATINAIIGIIMGDWWYVFQVFAVFTVVHYLMTALALRIDGESQRLLGYAVFLVFGFKQIVDALLLKALIEHLSHKKAKWTSAKRVGV